MHKFPYHLIFLYSINNFLVPLFYVLLDINIYVVR